MPNYLLAYTGGSMSQTDAEREAAMAAWGQWFQGLGQAVVDAGAPFGPSAAVSSAGANGGGGATGLTGYSIITADTLAAAGEMVKGCPVLANGGKVDVYEAIPVM